MTAGSAGSRWATQSCTGLRSQGPFSSQKRALFISTHIHDLLRQVLNLGEVVRPLLFPLGRHDLEVRFLQRDCSKRVLATCPPFCRPPDSRSKCTLTPLAKVKLNEFPLSSSGIVGQRFRAAWMIEWVKRYLEMARALWLGGVSSTTRAGRRGERRGGGGRLTCCPALLRERPRRMNRARGQRGKDEPYNRASERRRQLSSRARAPRGPTSQTPPSLLLHHGIEIIQHLLGRQRPSEILVQPEHAEIARQLDGQLFGQGTLLVLAWGDVEPTGVGEDAVYRVGG